METFKKPTIYKNVETTTSDHSQASKRHTLNPDNARLPSMPWEAIDEVAKLIKQGDDAGRGAEWRNESAEYHEDHLLRHFIEINCKGFGIIDPDSGKFEAVHVAARALMLVSAILKTQKG